MSASASPPIRPTDPRLPAIRPAAARWNALAVRLRLESSLLKVLKALAEYKDMSLGDLIEGIVLHAFDNKAPFSDETLAVIAQLKTVYGCDLDRTAAHRISDARGDGS